MPRLTKFEYDRLVSASTATVARLESLYTSMLTIVSELRTKNKKSTSVRISDLTLLLNCALPISEDEVNLSFYLGMMRSFNRDNFVTFMFRSHKASLLLLVPSTIAVAIKASDFLNIGISKGKFRVSYVRPSQAHVAVVHNPPAMSITQCEQIIAQITESNDNVDESNFIIPDADNVIVSNVNDSE